ncbi:MAG: tRNA glutamyl-Q(34) synthetase GluQRS [Woeseiaceae bacterium]
MDEKSLSSIAVRTPQEQPYCGRFAPSPTGPLHFGSLVAACASFLQARSAKGRWLLRIEDIDPPREEPGAAESIVSTLEAFGFTWDGPVSYQIANTARHLELVDYLLREAVAYRCSCTRKDLAGARRGVLGAIYPGTCRTGHSGKRSSVRVRTSNLPVEFFDLLQGPQSQALENVSGDFVIKRRDGMIAYHLAVVADDHDQSVTEVVRGIDLLDSTPRQIHLQRLLGFATPQYLHIPVVIDDAGNKLSKQTGAPGLQVENARQLLVLALTALGQNPPAGLADCRLDEIWHWAETHWDAGVLASQRAIPLANCPMAEVQNGLS